MTISLQKQFVYDFDGPKYYGTYPPLNQAKEELVTIFIQMGKCWQLLSVKEGIELMNSFIGGTHLEKL